MSCGRGRATKCRELVVEVNTLIYLWVLNVMKLKRICRLPILQRMGRRNFDAAEPVDSKMIWQGRASGTGLIQESQESPLIFLGISARVILF